MKLVSSVSVVVHIQAGTFSLSWIVDIYTLLLLEVLQEQCRKSDMSMRGLSHVNTISPIIYVGVELEKKKELAFRQEKMHNIELAVCLNLATGIFWAGLELPYVNQAQFFWNSWKWYTEWASELDWTMMSQLYNIPHLSLRRE